MSDKHCNQCKTCIHSGLCYKEANRKVYTGKLKITPCEHFVDKSALEKQIPKKPKTNNDSWFCCRNCGETFSLANTLHKRNKYCGECGQKIDWGDCE